MNNFQQTSTLNERTRQSLVTQVAAAETVAQELYCMQD